MPNHVTHKIIFTADHHDAARIFSEACEGKTLAFNRLVPHPLSMYLGAVSAEDREDFKCNWLSWSKENWGTKWVAYAGDTGYSFDSRVAFIKFDTAWSIPYPIIAAFANRFQIAFEHRYFDEGGNFWGIEKWGRSEYNKEVMARIEKRKNHPDDARPLCVELKGYDPEERAREGQ